MKGQPFVRRLLFAARGCRLAVAREPSLRVQLAVVAGGAICLWILAASAVWWAVGAMAAGVVVASEMLNSAIEALADHLHPDQHTAIRLVKDMAAGAVLIASVAAMVAAIAFLCR